MSVPLWGTSAVVVRVGTSSGATFGLVPRKRPDRCRVCGDAADHISKRGLCIECGIERQTFAAIQLNAHEGPVYNSWREALMERLERM